MFENLSTEKRNTQSIELDTLSTLEMAKLMNDNNKQAAFAVEGSLPKIAMAIDLIVNCFQKGGRLIYIGAGTSGRIGVLDASECPPTFGTEPDMVIGLIAGGEMALRTPVENCEDDALAGADDLKKICLSSKDVVCGITASGRTPYVIGALRYAKELGCSVISLSNNRNAKISQIADVALEIVCGPEILTGSTRLKAGTTQKLVLNMLTTLSMVKTGRVYKNLMVALKASNFKLKERSKNITMEATGCTYETAEQTLSESDFDVKATIVMILSGCSFEQAQRKLLRANGFIRKAIEL